MSSEQNSPESHERPPLFTRRRLLVGATAVVASDIASRYTLSHGIDVLNYRQTAAKNTGLLSVVTPGLNGNLRHQAQPLFPIMRRYGDVVGLQPIGDRYSGDEMAERTAEVVQKSLSSGKYETVVFNGISMGGNVAADAVALLHRNKTFEATSTEVYATMFDTPSSADDLPGFSKLESEIVSIPLYGRISNLIPAGKLFVGNAPKTNLALGADANELNTSFNAASETSVSMWTDELSSIVDRHPPKIGSLACLKSLVYWESQDGGAIVNAETARAAWFSAVNDASKSSSVTAKMPHAGFELAPDEARSVLHRVYRNHLER